MGSNTQVSLEIADHVKGYFSRHAPEGVACAYFFGSVARSKIHRHSDIDVAVLREDGAVSADTLALDLADDLQSELKRPVDLLRLNRCPVDLVHRVLRDGILVYERNRSKRARFEVKARNEYFDLLPYLRQYRRRAPEPIHD